MRSPVRRTVIAGGTTALGALAAAALAATTFAAPTTLSAAPAEENPVPVCVDIQVLNTISTDELCPGDTS